MPSSPRLTSKAFKFLTDLSENNNRDWFNANKDRFEDDLREPALQFIRDFAPYLADISPYFRADPRRSGGSMFRIYRDVRFSKDKSPYKTYTGLQFRHERGKDAHGVIQQIVEFANKARKEGIVALDGQLETIEEPFLKKSLMLAVDGTEPQELRKMMELELDNQAERQEKIPQVFESAGGFSPTIGIIGAVMGLIQVMQHLDDIEQVGHGIAVAFVATIYGVGVSNLFFLPAAGKLKIRIREEQVVREIMLEGVVSILEGMNPRMLETKLLGFLPERGKPAPEQEEEAA